MNKTPEAAAEQARWENARAVVLALLHERGLSGVLNTELNEIAFRYGARIFELRQMGHDIRKECVGPGVWRYWLVPPVPPDSMVDAAG